MNADTGQVYDLRDEVIGGAFIGDQLGKEEMQAGLERLFAEGEPATPDEMAAAVDAAKGDTIVRVGEEAAQRARLGDRELRRRRQRRR